KEKKKKKERKRKRKKKILFCLCCQKSVWCQTLQMTVKYKFFFHFIFGSCLLRHLITDVRTVMCTMCTCPWLSVPLQFQCVFLYAVYTKLM
uniref:Uncharacterized protein n=1 Tax=Piliocolobus tephrosceles TaxID=591936 RepID=A0A8C9HR55_9PRIM